MGMIKWKQPIIYEVLLRIGSFFVSKSNQTAGIAGPGFTLTMTFEHLYVVWSIHRLDSYKGWPCLSLHGCEASVPTLHLPLVSELERGRRWYFGTMSAGKSDQCFLGSDDLKVSAHNLRVKFTFFKRLPSQDGSQANKTPTNVCWISLRCLSNSWHKNIQKHTIQLQFCQQTMVNKNS